MYRFIAVLLWVIFIDVIAPDLSWIRSVLAALIGMFAIHSFELAASCSTNGRSWDRNPKNPRRNDPELAFHDGFRQDENEGERGKLVRRNGQDLWRKPFLHKKPPRFYLKLEPTEEPALQFGSACRNKANKSQRVLACISKLMLFTARYKHHGTCRNRVPFTGAVYFAGA